MALAQHVCGFSGCSSIAYQAKEIQCGLSAGEANASGKANANEHTANGYLHPVARTTMAVGNHTARVRPAKPRASCATTAASDTQVNTGGRAWLHQRDSSSSDAGIAGPSVANV